jgi:hypothetical protein
VANKRAIGGDVDTWGQCFLLAEYADNLIRNGHVLTTNTCWGYDYKGEHSMTVKGLVTMVVAPMFSFLTLKAQRIPLHVEWLPIHLPDKWRRYCRANIEGDISVQTSVPGYRYWRRLRYRYWRCIRQRCRRSGDRGFGRE